MGGELEQHSEASSSEDSSSETKWIALVNCATFFLYGLFYYPCSLLNVLVPQCPRHVSNPFHSPDSKGLRMCRSIFPVDATREANDSASDPGTGQLHPGLRRPM